MASTIPIKIRGKTLHVTPGTKSAIARFLLDEGYTASEISKAVPMAYSQVHQLLKKLPPTQVGKIIKTRQAIARSRPATFDVVKASKGQDPWGELPPRGRPKTKPRRAAILKTGLQASSKITRVGKLRTPGFPSDVSVGACANCGHDLVVRPLPSGFSIVHVNHSTEEYLAVIQFCNACPEVLVK